MWSPSWVKSPISLDFSLKSCHRLSNSFYLHKPSLNFSLEGKKVCPLLGNCLPPNTSINSLNVVGFLRALPYGCSWEKSFFVGKENIWTFMFFFYFQSSVNSTPNNFHRELFIPDRILKRMCFWKCDKLAFQRSYGWFC